MKAFTHILVLLAYTVAIFLGSCKKEPISPTMTKNSHKENRVPNSFKYCGNVTVTKLLAGQFTDAGQVIVTNNDNTLFVTYKTKESWVLNELHLYVGDLRLLPKTPSGNAIPGQFPFYKKFNGDVQEYTFAIPLIEVNSCFAVAAHASIKSRIINEGDVVETAWGEGTLISEEGNWSMYFNVCKQFCGGYEL